MKCVVNKTALNDSLTNVSRVIPAKSSVPALEGVQLKAYQDKLTLTGYDMEAGITTTIPADIEEPGEIVLTAKLFSDMIRKMDCEDVLLTVNEKLMAEISGGAAKFSVLGIPSSEFPELPRVEDGEGVALPQGILKSMIDQTLFAIAQNDSKPVHTGSLFDFGGGKLTIVSVDGYRLALRSEAAGLDNSDMRFVVPGKILGDISKILKEDGEDPVSMTVSKRHIAFMVGSYSVISRLLEGEFLNYKEAVPSGNTTLIKAGVREFIEGAERASLLISDRLRSPLRVIFSSEGIIKIFCSTPLGKSYEEVDCDIQGEEVEIGFNNKYLLDALRAADTDQVRIELTGPLAPVKILPPEGDAFLFLVLPVRLKND